MPDQYTNNGKRQNVFSLFVGGNKKTFEYSPQQSRGFWLRMQQGSDVYCINGDNMLYRFNAETTKIDSIEISLGRTLYAVHQKYKNRDVVVVTGSQGYTMHELPSLKVVQKVPSQQSLQGTGKPPIAGDKIYCLMQKNELVSYDLSAKKNSMEHHHTSKTRQMAWCNGRYI
jgi:hypothetical protein